MTSIFRYPFVTPILYDPHVEDEAFAELKELFIEIISRPIYISNLNFVTEMKNNYAVYVEDIANYKKLYSYMVGQATAMYYQLCENNFKLQSENLSVPSVKPNSLQVVFASPIIEAISTLSNLPASL